MAPDSVPSTERHSAPGSAAADKSDDRQAVGGSAAQKRRGTALKAEIEQLCRDSYERGARDAVSSLVEAFRCVGMTDAARLAEDALPRLTVPKVAR